MADDEGRDYVADAVLGLKASYFFTMATVCEDGSPWATPVYMIRDEQCQLYTASWVENVHSQNLVRTGQAFVVGFEPETASGTYMKMLVRRIDEPSEVEKVLAIEPESKIGQQTVDYYSGDSVARLFCFIPEQMWVNNRREIGNARIDVRHEVDIANVIVRLKESA